MESHHLTRRYGQRHKHAFASQGTASGSQLNVLLEATGTRFPTYGSISIRDVEMISADGKVSPTYATGSFPVGEMFQTIGEISGTYGMVFSAYAKVCSAYGKMIFPYEEMISTTGKIGQT